MSQQVVEKEKGRAANLLPAAQNVDQQQGYRASSTVSRTFWLGRAADVLAGLIVNLETGVHLSPQDQALAWLWFERLLTRYLAEKRWERR